MLFPYMQRVWIIVIITCVSKWRFLTRWSRDKMTKFAYHFQIFFFRRLKKSLQFVPKGAVNYKSKLVQAMAWHKEDTKPFPGSVVIQANGEYMSLSDWLSWLITSPYWENISMRRKNGTVWAHEGYLHPHNWKWAIPTPQFGSGRGTGWPYIVKSPVTQQILNETTRPTWIPGPGQYWKQSETLVTTGPCYRCTTINTILPFTCLDVTNTATNTMSNVIHLKYRLKWYFMVYIRTFLQRRICVEFHHQCYPFMFAVCSV